MDSIEVLTITNPDSTDIYYCLFTSDCFTIEDVIIFNQWTSISFTNELTSGTTNVYINGELKDT